MHELENNVDMDKAYLCYLLENKRDNILRSESIDMSQCKHYAHILEEALMGALIQNRTGKMSKIDKKNEDETRVLTRFDRLVVEREKKYFGN